MKIACVNYINALPMVWKIPSHKHTIIYAPPAQLFDYLLKKEVDAALLPIYNYFQNPKLFLLPKYCIATHAKVESVKLIARQAFHLDSITEIYLDPESKSSQALVKVLLKEKYKRDLREISFVSSPTPKTQAYLQIGDKALTPSKTLCFEIDLGEEWTSWQKAPFVFAAWMSFKSEIEGLEDNITQSYTQFQQHLDNFLDQIPNYPKKLLKDYFTKAIQYSMGKEELGGIEKFYNFLKPIEGFDDALNFRFISKSKRRSATSA